jgi:hypothetical protein
VIDKTRWDLTLYTTVQMQFYLVEKVCCGRRRMNAAKRARTYIIYASGDCGRYKEKWNLSFVLPPLPPPTFIRREDSPDGRKAWKVSPYYTYRYTARSRVLLCSRWHELETFHFSAVLLLSFPFFTTSTRNFNINRLWK